MNAISPRRPRETQPDRTDRHLDMCRELAELGMGVARVTAACAMADYATPPEPAEHPEIEHTAEPPPTTPRRTCAALAFARASRAVRQAIALETRILAGDTARAPRAAPDPRRDTVRRALHDATKDHPDRRDIRRDIDERLDHEIAADADADIPTLFTNICNDLGITPDFATLPDEILGMDTAPIDGDEITDWPAFLAAYYDEPNPAPA